MKIEWDRTGQDPDRNHAPYDEISDIIMKKYGWYGCCLDFIVRIRLKYECEEKYREYNELIYNDGLNWENPDLVWQNDWWEGEPDVELLGCIPIDELSYPYDQRWLM